MIFVNNPGVSAGRIGRSCGRRTFGTLSRNAQPYESEDSEESDNFLLGCTVASFGVAITLALVLLPLSICCSFLIYHPLFIFGVVLFFSLTLIGGILCVWHPVMTRCWWYKEDFCNRNTSRQASYTSRLPPTKLSSTAGATDVEADAENEIGFMENSVPYEDVFLNGVEPTEYASNSFAKSRICVGTSIICLLGTFVMTILVGSFVISPSVGLVTAILIGFCFLLVAITPPLCRFCTTRFCPSS